jgi:eukaryotic-like serine/threonine-protein kinase
MANSSKISKQFGKYRIIAHLATGGMADIFLAAQTSLGGFEKLMVIKRILSHLAREERFIEMFLDEARIAAVLNHPNVVQIFDLGRIENQYFIAMEYLPGESLAMVVKTCRNRGEPLAPELSAGIIMQAAEGLQHAHTMTGKDGKPLGIVHRDISPQNIFVLYDGGVKVVDFGIARAASLRTTQTRTGTLKGKYSYMSPEQILGGDLDGRSDVFSLGIVLWECLTGRKLFRHESDLKLLQSITDEDAPSPLSINPNLPPVIVEITMKALARNRDQRYQSAADLRSALSTYLKVCAVEADTMAIGKLMQILFVDRIGEKRKLIEGAQTGEAELGDYLFGDLKQYQSDTEHSVPAATPPAIELSAEDIVPTFWARLRHPAVWISFLVLLIGGGLGLGRLLSSTPNDTNSFPSQKTLDLFAKKSPTPNPSADAGSSPNKSPEAGKIGSDPKKNDNTTEPALVSPGAGNRWGSETVQPKKPQPKKIQTPPKPKDNQPTAAAQAAAAMPPKTEEPENKTPSVPTGPPGTLRLTTNPWTDIYFNGKRLGQTPLLDVELPAGRLKLKAVNKEMGIDETISVEIKSGERTNQRYNFNY